MFIDPDGNLYPVNGVTKTLDGAGGRANGASPPTIVVTPTVLTEVRAQSGCPTLPGAILENDGGSGSALSHWEYELFQVGVVLLYVHVLAAVACCCGVAH